MRSDSLVTHHWVKQTKIIALCDYFMHNCNLIFDKSDGCTNAACVKFLFCFLVFFVRIWLLKACFLLILPEPVIVKRFFALDFVFIFGISLVLKNEQTISYFDRARRQRLFLFRIDHYNHSFSFQFWHLLQSTNIRQFLNKFQ